MSARMPYGVVDTLYLWHLGNPAKPLLVGDLHWLPSPRCIALQYDAAWIKTGFALSDDLPLIADLQLARDRDSAPGAVDDARPDRWGERVIRHLDPPPRFSLLEMLYFTGDDRFGALSVSSSRSAYLPRHAAALPTLRNIDALHSLVQKVIAGEPISEAQRRLISPGATMGGARPKALISIDGASWIVKFAEAARPDEALIEHAAMTLAARADIEVAETRLIPFKTGTAIAIKRFDRAKGVRRHAISANVALKAAHVDLSYPNLAQLLRRRGPTENDHNRQQMRELFRRLVFNILIDNTDDHEKNHALLLTDAHDYILSPAFDVLPTGQALGQQAMAVGVEGAASTLVNAASNAAAYGLRKDEAKAQIQQVVDVVANWQAHFLKMGVAAATVRALAMQIDRPFLAGQREKT